MNYRGFLPPIEVVNMIFPLDVNKSISDQKKIAGENKVQLTIVLFVVGSAIAFIAIDYIFCIMLGLSLGVAVGVFLVLLLMVGVLVFRFLIFDEDAKKKELEGSDSDSFSRYMWLRSEIRKSATVQEKLSIYEFTNGSAMCAIELRFGSNNDEKTSTTAYVNEAIIQLANEYKLESRIIVMPEDFANSEDFRRDVLAINAIKDKDAAKNVMIINDAIMEESCKCCNVDIVYIMLRTLGNYQLADLEIVLRKLIGLFSHNVTAYRSIHFLEPDELMEFYREFYGIAAIDLSMMRTLELSQQLSDEFDNVVSTLRLKTKTGRVFESDTVLIKETAERLN